MDPDKSAKRLAGGCRCGAVRYDTALPLQAAICHCEDCRHSAGAPMVAWMGVAASALRITKGKPQSWSFNGKAQRHFCPVCGTGLFYMNESVIPGMIDVQIATLDDASAVVPEIQVQVAERLPWVANIHQLPSFDRFPD